MLMSPQAVTGPCNTMRPGQRRSTMATEPPTGS